MNDFKGRLALITGANSGIGEALALALAREGARLVLTARDTAKLEAVRARCTTLGADTRVFAADVTDDAQMQALADFVHATDPALDLLVNNAGMVMSGLMVDVPLSDWQQYMDVNVFGVVRACRLFLPRMIERRQGGHVLNIGSAAGLVGQPGMSTYCATKHAVVGLSASLRYELARNRIGVTALCPGYVRTPIQDKLKLVGRLNTEQARRKVAQTFERNKLTAEEVAQRALKAVRRNEALAYIGKDARLAYWGRRLIPGLMDRALSRGAG